MNAVRSSTTRARRSSKSAIEFLARSGFVASGIIHILIGYVAIRVAFGHSGAEADQSGALEQLAATPGGSVVLWITFVGLAALGVWLVANAFIVVRRKQPKRGATFATNLAKGIVYLVLAATTFTFARGASTSSSQSARDASQTLLGIPGGRVLVAIVGVGVVAVGIYLFVKGATRRFTKDLTMPSGRARQVTVIFGVAGYVAKAIALATVGVLLLAAATTLNASKATGLDGALKTLASLPFGRFILLAVAVGLIAYGLYSFFRARLARL